VRQLALFHHDPVHDDDMVRSLEQYARDRALAAGSTLQIFAAAEGLTVELEESGTKRPLARASALDRRPIRGGRVLVVGGTAADVTAVEVTLSEEDLRTTTASTGKAAIERTIELQPDIVILDSKLPDGNAAAFVQPIRDAAGRPELPILILTHRRQRADTRGVRIRNGRLPGAPYSPPMLRSVCAHGSRGP
jgi:CheY-like chemotaxis protein